MEILQIERRHMRHVITRYYLLGLFVVLLAFLLSFVMRGKQQEELGIIYRLQDLNAVHQHYIQSAEIAAFELITTSSAAQRHEIRENIREVVRHLDVTLQSLENEELLASTQLLQKQLLSLVTLMPTELHVDHQLFRDVMNSAEVNQRLYEKNERQYRFEMKQKIIDFKTSNFLFMVGTMSILAILTLMCLMMTVRELSKGERDNKDEEVDSLMSRDLSEGLLQHNAHILFLTQNPKPEAGMIEKWGVDVIKIENMRIAIEAYIKKKEKIDVILMKCDECCALSSSLQRIMKKEHDALRLPIIAIVPEGSETSQEHYLGAGIDEVIVEPIQEDALYAILEKWIMMIKETKDAQPLTDEGKHTMSIDTSASFQDFQPILDQELLDEAVSMASSKFPVVVEYFLEDTPGYIEQITQGLDDNDLEKVIPPAHTIKSSSRQLGAVQLSDTAENIEAKARSMVEEGLQDQTGELSALLKDLTRYYGQSETALREFVSHMGDKN